MEISLSSADCRKAAAILEAASQGSPSSQLMLLCARCLYEIAESGPRSIHNIHVGFPFLSEAERKIRTLCAAGSLPPELLYDLAFELVECFAVIAKENAMSKGARRVSPAQAEVMRYFEESGEWAPDDGTLVTQYYYLLISNEDPARTATQ